MLHAAMNNNLTVECPYPSSLFPAATFVSKLRHGSDQCTQTEKDGISMADIVLPRSTLINSIAGFLFIVVFSRQRKRTQKQQLQQHAEGNLETDVIIIWSRDRVRINTTINQIYTTTTTTTTTTREQKDMTRTGCKRKQPHKYTSYRPVVEPKQSAYSLHGEQNQ